jgi:hypothetical protein
METENLENQENIEPQTSQESVELDHNKPQATSQDTQNIEASRNDSNQTNSEVIFEEKKSVAALIAKFNTKKEKEQYELEQAKLIKTRSDFRKGDHDEGSNDGSPMSQERSGSNSNIKNIMAEWKSKEQRAKELEQQRLSASKTSYRKHSNNSGHNSSRKESEDTKASNIEAGSIENDGQDGNRTEENSPSNIKNIMAQWKEKEQKAKELNQQRLSSPKESPIKEEVQSPDKNEIEETDTLPEPQESIHDNNLDSIQQSSSDIPPENLFIEEFFKKTDEKADIQEISPILPIANKIGIKLYENIPHCLSPEEQINNLRQPILIQKESFLENSDIKLQIHQIVSPNLATHVIAKPVLNIIKEELPTQSTEDTIQNNTQETLNEVDAIKIDAQDEKQPLIEESDNNIQHLSQSSPQVHVEKEKEVPTNKHEEIPSSNEETQKLLDQPQEPEIEQKPAEEPNVVPILTDMDLSAKNPSTQERIQRNLQQGDEKPTSSCQVCSIF